MSYRDILELFSLIYAITINGGWIVLAVALLYMFYTLYMQFIQTSWYNDQEWVFLKITPPKDNEKSPLAFEQVLTHLHSMQLAVTWPEIYIEGQIQLWATWEVVSVGGTINNYVKIVTKFRDTFEAALYSQYPEAEITEVEDYLEKLPAYHPETSDYDLYALGWLYQRPNFYPIRTYYDFEHSAAETFIDPVTGIWEELSKINPYEMVVLQFVLRPVKDEDWKEDGRKLIKKLKGEPEANKEPEDWVGKILNIILGPIMDIFLRRPSGPEVKRQSHAEPPPSLMLHLTEGEKEIISAVERKLARYAYQVKITFYYIAPKDKFAPRAIWGSIVGAFKSINAFHLNQLKPDTKRWTRVNYKLFEALERPIVKLRLHKRKREFMKRLRKRFYFWGPRPNIMSTEEIATLLHFPQTEVTVPQIERVSVSKVQPPPELPIAG